MKRSGAVARGLSTRSLLPVPSLQPHLSLSRASLSFPRHRRSFSSPTLRAPHPSPFSCASSSTASLPSLLLFGVSAASARTSVTRRPLGFHAPARPYATTQEMYSKDLYSVLGVKGSATQDEIKTAFYKKAKEYHPDMNKENPHAQKKFVEATSAYEILKDTRKRSEYDGVRRMRTDSSSTYTSYTHSDYANYGGSGRARRGDDFGMGHEDFTRWYQQRSDIFEDFEKMFKDIAERMSKKMKAQWIRMCENGEVGFEDIYDIYGRMQRTERKTKKRQDKKKKKADERRRHTNHTAGCDGYATTNGPPRQQKKKERKGKSEDDATQASQRTEKKESSGEEGGKKRAKSEGNAKNEGNAKGGSQRRSSSRARKDYQWGKWDRKHAINAEKEGSDRESSSGSGRESREQKATEDARRKERRWQKKKAEIRKRWRHGYHDPDMIIFF